MYSGTACGIRLGLSEHLARDRGGVSLSEQEVTNQIDDGIPHAVPLYTWAANERPAKGPWHSR